MSAEELLQVFPAPARHVALRGLYLSDALRPAGSATRPFVYANFVASLDGRIALVGPDDHVHQVPKTTANTRDWRLYQELVAGADVLVTSGRYMRELARGNAQAGVPIGESAEFADLVKWRGAQGRTLQPALAIVSASLDFSIPDKLPDQRSVYVVTGAGSERNERTRLAAQGADIVIAGNESRVAGKRLIAALTGIGFANIELIGGAELLGALLADRVLDRLYLTQAHRILGGRAFDTLLNSPLLDPPVDFRLHSLCLDTAAGFEQSFSIYDRCPPD